MLVLFGAHSARLTLKTGTSACSVVFPPLLSALCEHNDLLIAFITSCLQDSKGAVMFAAHLHAACFLYYIPHCWSSASVAMS